MIKKIISFVTAFAFMLAYVPLYASAYTEGSGWIFDESTGTLTITTDEGTTAWKDGMPNSSDREEKVKKVVISDGVTSIGDWAFYCCSSLTSADMPQSIKTIGTYAFGYCENLASIDIPSGVETIGEGAFSMCSALTSVKLPDGITVIPKYLFDHCENLYSVTMHGGITAIESSAFAYCSALESMNIPEGVQSIGSSAFAFCTNLRSVEIPKSTVSIGQSTFSSCSSLSSVTISEGVETIGQWAFSGTVLENVVLPSTITSVGYNAFKNAANAPLNQIIYPQNVTVSPLPETTVQVKYTTDDKGLIINDVTVGNSGNLAVIPDEVSGFHVYYVEESYREYVSEDGHTHRYAWEDSDCSDYDACAICGKYGKYGEHKYVLYPESEQHYLKCSLCGDIDTDSYEDHLAEGDFITDMPNYNYDEYHYQKCKCGLVMGLPHVWDEGAEKDDVITYTCTICGAEKTETVIHNYVLTPDDTGLQHCMKCSECGKTLPGSFEDHLGEGDFITDNPNYNYKEYHYQKCICGLVVGLLHTPDNGTVITEPTYDEEGKIEYRCTVCGYLIGETAVAPLSHNIESEWQSDVSGHWHNCECGERHSFGEHISDGGKTTKEATYTEEGIKVYSCTVCGYVLKNEDIPMLSHKGVTADCEWASDESGHWIEGCGCGEIHEFAEHTPDSGTVTAEPTYDEEGEIEYCCTVCGYLTKTESIPATGEEKPDNPDVPVKPSIPSGSFTTGEQTEPVKPDEPNEPAQPVVPDEPKEQENGVPFIENEYGKNGWELISAEAEAARDGDTLNVNMNGTTFVPGHIFDVIKDRNVTISFDMGEGIKWTVNGGSVTDENISDIDLAVTRNANVIPIDIVNNVTGGRYSVQIRLAHSGEFGFTAALTINLGSDNAGYYAWLYYYGDSLELIGESGIDGDGTAEFLFTHASDYLIAIGEKSDNENEDEEQGDAVDDEEILTNSTIDKSDDNPVTGVSDNSGQIMLIGLAAASICLSLNLRRKKD